MVVVVVLRGGEDVLNLRWAMRFWMRRLSSGSVTSVQSSVFLVLDEGLSRFEMECLDDLEDILDGSFSVSDPEVGLLLPFFLLLRLFPEWEDEEGRVLLCLGVE